MRRNHAQAFSPEIVTWCIRVKLFVVGNTRTEIIVLHTTRHCFHFVMLQIDFKCILFIKSIWGFTENTLLISGTEPLLIQASLSKYRQAVALLWVTGKATPYR